ncbi:MAG: glycoside hydrolase family 32 protein [Verrucomicrobiota bacterium]
MRTRINPMLTHHRTNRIAVALFGMSCGAVFAAEDLLVADFEGPDFGAWKTTGEAFGKAPAHGTLQGQMAVDGFVGAGLASSFHNGDDATGTLVSPPFKVARKYLNFLLGGGGFAGETCINLRLLGKIVRTATGPNQKPGGSEHLDWQSWDMADLMGKSVSVEIIDSRKGGWGHVSVDNIVQSDTPQALEIRQEFVINQRYLIWPVCLDTKQKRRFFLTLDGEKTPLAFSDICLSEHPDFWVFTDLGNYMGRKLTVTGKLPGALAEAWKMVAISATYPGEQQIYHEALRPQYHFTSRRGWLNDPNGLVWKDGVWQLFYQHNPYNHGWDNMHWGHATSSDLLHWQELPPALFPDAEGAMFSGSGTVAAKKQIGIPLKGDSALVVFYTAEGSLSFIPGHQAEQGLAYSEDQGKTFRKYPSNPVIPHFRAGNRDPNVFWYAPTQHWVLNLYYDGNDYGIYTSTDMVKWEKTCDYRIPGDGECPDMFELPVDGNAKDTRWIVWGANGKYMLGSFDGRKFTAESGPHRHYFGSAYAGQTYDNAPAGRRVHIGWMRAGDAEMQGAPFNCQMTVPMDFTLRNSGGAIRLWAEPSEETAKLRETTQEWKNLDIAPGAADPLADFSGGQFEIEAVIDAASPAAEMGLDIFGGHPAVWKKQNQAFSGTDGPQAAVDGKLRIHIFVDTVSMEVFVNGTYTGCYLRQTPGTKPVRVIANGGAVHFDSLKIHSLRSVWK